MGSVKPKSSSKQPSKAARRTKPSSSGSRAGPKGSSKAGSSGSKPRPPPKNSKAKAPPPRQQKTKSAVPAAKKKRRVYTEEELDIPKLNMITPVGVQKPKGKKKGKVFVDDKESMMTILAMVNAEKEGQLESKIMKARHLEEIREARSKEQEAKYQARQSKLDDAKDAVRQDRKRKRDHAKEKRSGDDDNPPVAHPAKSKKRVSFK